MHNNGETQSQTALVAKPTLKLPSKEVVPVIHAFPVTSCFWKQLNRPCAHDLQKQIKLDFRLQQWLWCCLLYCTTSCWVKNTSDYTSCILIYWAFGAFCSAARALCHSSATHRFRYLPLQVLRVLQSLVYLLLIILLEEVLEEGCFSKLVLI